MIKCKASFRTFSRVPEFYITASGDFHLKIKFLRNTSKVKEIFYTVALGNLFYRNDQNGFIFEIQTLSMGGLLFLYFLIDTIFVIKPGSFCQYISYFNRFLTLQGNIELF